jgi:hypothetical protein
MLTACRDLFSVQRDTRSTVDVLRIGERVLLEGAPVGHAHAALNGRLAVVCAFANCTERVMESVSGIVPVRLETAAPTDALLMCDYQYVRRLPPAEHMDTSAADGTDEAASGNAMDAASARSALPSLVDSDSDSDDDDGDDGGNGAPLAAAADGAQLLVVTIPRDATPYKEFTENRKAICSVFPYSFPLGTGPCRDGSLSTANARHLLKQFNPAVSANKQLLFLLFNQAVRHATCARVAALVRDNSTAFRQFEALCKDKTLDARLAAAIAAPDDVESRRLLRQLQKILLVFQRQVPFSAESRKAKLGDATAMFRYFGPPSIFNTISPDPIGDVMQLRAPLLSPRNEISAFLLYSAFSCTTSF